MKYSTKKTFLISIMAVMILSSMIVPALAASASSETQLQVVSATASSWSSVYPPAYAIDGVESSSNYWGTFAALGLPQWLQLDLGSQVSMNQITTHFYDWSSRVYSYYIGVSADGSSWTTVVPAKSASGVVTDVFSAVVARFVRISVTGNTANSAAHIEEIKVFQSTTGAVIPTPAPTPSSTPTPTLTPIVPPVTGSETSLSIVSATASSYNGITYGPKNAIDGVESSSNYWGTSAALGLPQWLQLDLGSQVSMNQITTHFYDWSSRVYSYYIGVSADGSSWTTVVPAKSASGVVTDVFSAVVARFVRISVTGNTANSAAHIEEIRVFQSTTGAVIPTPAPTPTPSLNPTPTPSSIPTSPDVYQSNSLSCIGGDYLVWSNGDPSAWDSQLHWFTQFHATGARLSFSFANDGGRASQYSYSKLNSVLTKLSSVGVKAVICDFPGDDSHFYGSQAWVNNWKQVATDFKGDSRIAAFEIANEPYQNYLASNANTMSSFNAACSSLIDQIRNIDPSRTIMYPIEFNIFTNDINAFYNDLVNHGITTKGNIIYDIVHPYYFQDYPKMDGYNNPVDCADGVWYSLVLPQIQKFGVSNVWCGETFCWPRGANGGGWNGQININYADQQAFEVRMINYFVSVGMGFQMWCFFTSSDQQAQINAITSSNY